MLASSTQAAPRLVRLWTASGRPRLSFQGWLRILLPSVLATFAPLAELQADEFHNINGFFGDRAPGLAGAFTAVSDDPSGLWYNPAGLALAQSAQVSLSTGSYRRTRKHYLDATGPGQNYLATSQEYLPNFLGAIRRMGDWTVGVALVNPVKESFHQSDEFYLPQWVPEVARLQVAITDNTDRFFLGVGGARRLSESLSFGFSVYAFRHTRLSTQTSLVETKAGSYEQESIDLETVVDGVEPVLGLLWVPGPLMSVGVSLRRKVVTSGHRRESTLTQGFARSGSLPNGLPVGASELTVELDTHRGYSGKNQTGVLIGDGSPASIPQPAEARFGVAFFPSRYWLFSFDLQHTRSFEQRGNRDLVEPNRRVVLVRDSAYPELTRQRTNNAAAGVEWYLTDNFVVRAGVFGNQSAAPEVRWEEAALRAVGFAAAQASGGVLFALPAAGFTVAVIPDATVRADITESVNLRGASLGLGYESASSSIAITFVEERGTGLAQLAPFLLAREFRYRSRFVYLTATTRL